LMSIHAAGLRTGVAVDIGDGPIYVVPIFDGCVLQNAILRMDISGKDLTEDFMRIIKEYGVSDSGFFCREIAYEMKEELCYVALDPLSEFEKSPSDIEKEFELPDGLIIKIGKERFMCPETLFYPELGGYAYVSPLPEIIFNSVMKCDESIRNSLFSNIVLSGGSSLFNGLPERLQKELQSLVPPDVKVNVIAPPDRIFSAWKGASMAAQKMREEVIGITRKEYDEFGEAIVHRKYCQYLP